jgi:hypothetical protein
MKNGPAGVNIKPNGEHITVLWPPRFKAEI